MKCVTGYRIFLINESSSEVRGSAGLIVNEFYKGKWSDKAVEGKESLLFELPDSDAQVMVGSNFSTLNALIVERQRVKWDEPQVRYHEMTAAPRAGQPTHFTLTTNQSCYFVLDPLPVKGDTSTEDKEVEFAHMGSAIPPKVWLSSDILALTWHMK